METAIRIRRPAARPSRVFAVGHAQEVVGRLRAEVVLAVDRDVGIAGRGAKRESVGIARSPDNDAGVAPVTVKTQDAGAPRVALRAHVASRPDPQQTAG